MDEKTLIQEWILQHTQEEDSVEGVAPTNLQVLYAHFIWRVLESNWWRDPPNKRLFKTTLIEWQKASKYGFVAGSGTRSTPLRNGTSVTPLFNLVIKSTGTRVLKDPRVPQMQEKINELEKQLLKANKVADIYKTLVETIQL